MTILLGLIRTIMQGTIQENTFNIENLPPLRMSLQTMTFCFFDCFLDTSTESLSLTTDTVVSAVKSVSQSNASATELQGILDDVWPVTASFPGASASLCNTTVSSMVAVVPRTTLIIPSVPDWQTQPPGQHLVLRNQHCQSRQPLVNVQHNWIQTADFLWMQRL